MAINSGFLGSVNFSKVRTEFAGFNGSVPLSYYRIANGYVANHENNTTSPASIPTTNSNLGLSKWIGSDIDFESSSYTDGGYTYTTYFSPSNSAYQQFKGAQTVDVPNGYSAYGTIGTVDLVGRSKSATTTAAVVGVFDWYSAVNVFPPPFYASFLYLKATGVDLTGTWWTSISVTQTGGGTVTLNRTSATTPAGTYDGVVTTSWQWNSSMGFNATGTYTVRIVL